MAARRDQFLPHRGAISAPALPSGPTLIAGFPTEKPKEMPCPLGSTSSRNCGLSSCTSFTYYRRATARAGSSDAGSSIAG